MGDGDFIGALRGREHGDDDADDGDGDDDADRDHDAQPRAIPTRVLLAVLGSTFASRQDGSPKLSKMQDFSDGTLASNACHFAVVSPTKWAIRREMPQFTRCR